MDSKICIAYEPICCQLNNSRSITYEAHITSESGPCFSVSLLTKTKNKYRNQKILKLQFHISHMLIYRFCHPYPEYHQTYTTI